MLNENKSFIRRCLSLFLSLVLAVSTLSAISVFAPLQSSFANQITQSSFDFNTGTAAQVMKTASNAGPIPASSNFSVESWVYIDSDTNNWQTIMTQNQPDTSCCTGRFYMGFPGGRNLHIGFETGYTDVAVIPTTTWTHIALTLQRDTPSIGVTTTKTYINGVLIQNKTDWPNNTFSSANGFSVGTATNGGYKLNGKIDQVKIWDGVLSQADVERSMSAYAAGGISTGTLRAHYDFNEGTGTTINDRSGISANLTVTAGDSVFSQSPTPPVTTSAAPTNVTVTAGYKQANLSWTAPTFNGGSTITGYTVTSSPLVSAPSACVNTANTSCTFTGLTAGTAYTFTVVAINTKGNSSSSAASSSSTPFGDCSNSPVNSGGFSVVTFTSVSTCNWSVPAGVTTAEVLVVGGGGGGGDSTTSATGGGGGAGGYFSSSSVAVSGNIAVTVGAGGSGAASSTVNGTSGGDSAFGTLKVGGGGYGNSVSFAVSQRAGSGIGGTGYVSGGSGGGGRSRGAGNNDAKLGGTAGARDASGVAFLGTTYTGLDGAAGGNGWEGDSASGSPGGAISSSSRTSSISGSSVVYSKGGTFRPWDSLSNTERPQTYGSGGAANYNYGSAETAGNTVGGNGAQGVVIVKYARPILTPTFGTVTPTSNGFTVQISNFDDGYTWSGTATANGTVSINGTGLVTVTGVAPGTLSTATITNTTVSYTGASANVSGTSNLGAALNPTFGTVTATAGGFTVQISNHSANYTWAGTATANGTVTVNGSGLVTVTGVEPGTSSTATITSTRTGYTSGSATVSGTSTARATVTNVTSTATNGSIKSGTQISITVTFSRAVTVTGSPRLTLETGTTDREATYFSGSSGTSLTFVYTVQSGDNSTDLDYVSTSSLILNGGTIKDSSSVDVSLTLPAPGAAGSIAANKALVIDGIAPTVTSVTSSTANGSYKVGASTIPIQVNFSENVTVALGTPYIRLSVGSDYDVNYVSGSGTSTLTFNYSIQSGHVSADLDYASTSSLSAYTATITDAAGNTAVLTLPSPGAAGSLSANKALVIDAVVPTVTSVTSDLANGSYKAGQVIPVKVIFSEAVIVTGTPTLGLSVTGGVARAINYTSGSGTSTLIFNYTVQASDISSDLNYAATNSLNLNSGTISDSASNTATLTLPATGAATSLGGSKAIVIDTLTPTLNSVSSTLIAGSYKTGQVIPVSVIFSEAVVVTGSPTIALNITNNSVQSSTLIATYASGSGTSTLTFNYTVQAGDSASDLDYTTTTALQLNGGSIADAAGNSPTLSLPSPGASGSLGANEAIILDTAAPTISSVTATSGRYGVGLIVNITVTFSEVVNVNTVQGIPQLLLETGTTDRYAIYNSGGGSNQLVFKYTVQAGDAASDLNYFATDSLTLNGGTFLDAGGNAAVLTLPALDSASALAGSVLNVIIDTAAPTVLSVTSTTTDGSKKTGSQIFIKIQFSKVVNVGANSTQVLLQLETGATDRSAVYQSGSNSDTLTFLYTVQAGDSSSDLDYSSDSALSVGSSSIKDSGGNNAVLTLPAPGATGSLGANKALVIDTTVPTAPANFILAASSDSGQSNTDGITNKSQLTFTGTAGPNQTITLSSAASPPPSCTSDSNGNFSCLSASGLTPGSYTFTATATNAAGTTSSVSSSVAVTIDYTAPTFSSSQVPSTGDKIILTYNGTLSTVTASLSAFTATVNNVSVSISSVVISGSTVELTLAKKVIQGATVRFTYTDPTGPDDANAIQDVAGNDAVSKSLTVVTNNSTLTAPSIATPSVGLTAIAMTLYSLPIAGATGGTGPYTYAVTTGLADLTSVGLSFDTSDLSALKITGTPTAAKSAFAVVITVTDSNGVDKATGSFNITVTSSSQLPITIATRYGTGGQALVLAIQGGSGSGALTYTLEPLVQTSCLLSGSVLTPNFATGTSGTCYVKATRAADAAFTATSSATTAIFFTAYVPVVQQTFTCPAGTTPSAPSGIGVGSCIQVLAPVSPTAGDSGAAPKITSLSATSGLVGATITITGTGFSTVTRVQFGTKSTTTFTATSTTITVDVPTGATRGRVMVVSPTGTAMAAQIFTVTIPDTQAPGFTGGNVNTSTPTQLTLNFDESIDGTGVLASYFAVSVNSVNRSITAISISGTTITLTLSSAVSTGQTVQFTYTSPGDSTSVKDAAGNKTATITLTGLANTLS